MVNKLLKVSERSYGKIIVVFLAVVLIGCETLSELSIPSSLPQGSIVPTQAEASEALRQALVQGTNQAVSSLSAKQAFLNNLDYKVLLPEETAKLEETLRSVGMGSEVDLAIEALNEGAAQAASKAAPIFVEAITSMTIQDALQIVTGEQDAATTYLKNSTEARLRVEFEPYIEAALEQTGATKYWTDLATAYNKIPFTNPVPVNLVDHVNERALSALYTEIRKEEIKIRTNPTVRSTAVMQKVFDYAQKN